jgi:serine/threonine protein kinase
MECICLYCAQSSTPQEGICSKCGMPVQGVPSSEHALPPGHTLQNGRYRIARVLGQGGFGITYLGRHEGLNDRVAIKEFFIGKLVRRSTTGTVCTSRPDREHVVERALSRFREEAQRIRSVRHENIVHVSDCFDENGTAYLVMDYLSGKTLAEVLSQHGRIAENHALQIMTQVMAGLRKLHETGMLHRDIKPDNVFITDEGIVKLIDFGSARLAVAGGQAFSSEARLTRQFTRGYAPPEQQAEDGIQGPYTDVYGCAATLYECLTGEPPPDAENRKAVDTLDPPASVPGVQVSASVNAAIMRALHLDPAERHQSVADFSRELVTASPPPPASVEPEVTPVTEPSPPDRDRDARAKTAAISRMAAIAAIGVLMVLGLAGVGYVVMNSVGGADHPGTLPPEPHGETAAEPGPIENQIAAFENAVAIYDDLVSQSLEEAVQRHSSDGNLSAPRSQAEQVRRDAQAMYDRGEPDDAVLRFEEAHDILRNAMAESYRRAAEAVSSKRAAAPAMDDALTREIDELLARAEGALNDNQFGSAIATIDAASQRIPVRPPPRVALGDVRIEEAGDNLVIHVRAEFVSLMGEELTLAPYFRIGSAEDSSAAEMLTLREVNPVQITAEEQVEELRWSIRRRDLGELRPGTHPFIARVALQNPTAPPEDWIWSDTARFDIMIPEPPPPPPPPPPPVTPLTINSFSLNPGTVDGARLEQVDMNFSVTGPAGAVWRLRVGAHQIDEGTLTATGEFSTAVSRVPSSPWGTGNRTITLTLESGGRQVQQERTVQVTRTRD